MKKWFFLLVFISLMPSAFSAEVDGRTEKGVLARTGSVMSRGILNIAGMPAEITSTFMREKETHSKLWPVTAIPRSINNIFVRSASAVNDFFFMPFSTAFSNDVSPITEPMGLPEYPWQVHEE